MSEKMEMLNRQIEEAQAAGAIPAAVLSPGRNNGYRKGGGRFLRWYERQWGAGFCFGMYCGAMLGVGLAIPVAFLAKWLVMKWVGM